MICSSGKRQSWGHQTAPTPEASTSSTSTSPPTTPSRYSPHIFYLDAGFGAGFGRGAVGMSAALPLVEAALDTLARSGTEKRMVPNSQQPAAACTLEQAQRLLDLSSPRLWLVHCQLGIRPCALEHFRSSAGLATDLSFDRSSYSCHTHGISLA